MNINIKNGIFSIVDTVFLPVLMLMFTPIIMNRLGLEDYGIWMLINSLVAVMAIINFGGGDTIIRYVSKYYWKHDYVAISEVFSTVILFQAVISVIIFVSAGGLSSLIVSLSFFNVSLESVDAFSVSLKYGFFIFSLKLIENIILSYFKGVSRFDISSSISVFSKLVLMITQVATVVCGGNVADVFESSFYCVFFMLAIELSLTFFFMNGLMSIKHIKMNRLKEVFGFTKWGWVLSIIGVLSNQIDRWLIGGFASMQVLSYYSISILVFNNLHAIISASMAWVLPKSAQEDKKGEHSDYTKLQVFVFFLSISISFVILNIEFFFKIWLGESNFIEVFPYVKSLVSLLPLYSLSIIPFYVVKGMGKIKINVYADVVILCSRVGIIMFLFELLEVYSVIIAMFISGFLFVVYLMFSLIKVQNRTRFSNSECVMIFVALFFPFLVNFYEEYVNLFCFLFFTGSLFCFRKQLFHSAIKRIL